MAARGHEVIAIGMHGSTTLPGVKSVVYTPSQASTAGVHPWVEDFESKIIRGEAVANVSLRLKSDGFVPDVICAHPGWGESLFLRDVWPYAKQLLYLEYYYHAVGADVGFDLEFPEDDFSTLARLRSKNAHHLLALETMDAGISPTLWQRDQIPLQFRDGVEVIHDGIDADLIRPNPAASLQSAAADLRLGVDDEVITFVSRSLEPCRGFHVFMRALPEILRRRPKARVLIVGSEAKGYGRLPSESVSWKKKLLDEVGSELDSDRVHFLGLVPHHVLIAIFQISTVHVYLTYPFVLSWSLLEAMSAGCLVVGSRTPPVQEVITHGHNGLLVEFFDVSGLSEAVCTALACRSDYVDIKKEARSTVVNRFDLKSICLPKQVALVEAQQR